MSLRILKLIKGSIFHPQWMTDRFHNQSKQCLKVLRNKVVLDIGSGNAKYLGEIHTSNSLITLDYPATNKRYVTDPQIFSDARSLPIADNKADVVLLFEVLEHVVETQKVIREIQRVLRPDGELYISVPFIYPIHDAPNDYWRFTIYGISEILVKNGFEIRQTLTHGNTLATALQMLNLGLLEICRDLYLANRLFSYFLIILLYPITLLINFIAWPVLCLQIGNAGNFGYFLTARAKEKLD